MVILYQKSVPYPPLRYLNHVLFVNIQGRAVTKLQNLWFDPFAMYISEVCLYCDFGKQYNLFKLKHVQYLV